MAFTRSPWAARRCEQAARQQYPLLLCLLAVMFLVGAMIAVCNAPRVILPVSPAPPTTSPSHTRILRPEVQVALAAVRPAPREDVPEATLPRGRKLPYSDEADTAEGDGGVLPVSLPRGRGDEPSPAGLLADGRGEPA